jgi:hypothetical protein
MIPFDIETKPRTDLVRRFIKPFPAFDPAAVKYGNTKDPAKRAELLALKESDHATEEQAYWKNAEDRASLNPLTAEIVCIGLLMDGKPVILSGNERDVLTEFWATFADHRLASEKFVFWSGTGNPSENFDVDMIVRRSWLLNVKVSPLAFSGRYLANRFEDAAGRYLLFKREAYCGLSKAALELGLFEGDETIKPAIFPKTDNDPVQGVNFYQWWEGTHANTKLSPAEQREWATKYLTNDLLILAGIVDRIF